jgi:hypothetical protein
MFNSCGITETSDLSLIQTAEKYAVKMSSLVTR